MVQVKADALSPFSDDEHDPDFDADADADDEHAGLASLISCNESEGAVQTQKH